MKIRKNRQGVRLLRLALAAIAAGGIMLGSAHAQDANNGAISVGTGIDFGSSYYFHGII